MIFRFICENPEAWGQSDNAQIPNHIVLFAPRCQQALMMMYPAQTLRDAMLPQMAVGQSQRQSYRRASYRR